MIHILFQTSDDIDSFRHLSWILSLLMLEPERTGLRTLFYLDSACERCISIAGLAAPHKRRDYTSLKTLIYLDSTGEKCISIAGLTAPHKLTDCTGLQTLF